MQLRNHRGRRNRCGRPVVRRLRVVAVAGAAVTLLLFGPLAGIASAHIEVSAAQAVQGSVTTVSFQVPTEKDVPTTKVVVAMPTDTPISEVLVKPMAGWKYSVIMAKPSTAVKNDDGDTVGEVVSRVTWTAVSGGIKPNEYGTFEVLAGPLPSVGALVFKVLQTYQDGSVVSWIEQQTKGAPEPDYPAPVLDLSPAGAAAVSDTAGGSASDTAAATAGGASTSGGNNSTATALGGVGLGLGVLALVVAGFALARTRRPVR